MSVISMFLKISKVDPQTSDQFRPGYSASDPTVQDIRGLCYESNGSVFFKL